MMRRKEQEKWAVDRRRAQERKSVLAEGLCVEVEEGSRRKSKRGKAGKAQAGPATVVCASQEANAPDARRHDTYERTIMAVRVKS